jgi:probable rRNA maturation factor
VRVHVDVQGRVAGSPSAARVRSVLTRASRAARLRPREVSVLFCADGRMRTLNRRWRGLDRPTDVLSFPSGEKAGAFLGDIVISVPYASRAARRRAEPPSREIDRLLVHGLLHLAGYDHETDHGEMDALEARVRRRLRIEDSSRGSDGGRR